MEALLREASRIAIQRQVRAYVVIICKIQSQNSLQMNFAEHDQVIQTFSTDGADKSFSVGIWTLCRKYKISHCKRRLKSVSPGGRKTWRPGYQTIAERALYRSASERNYACSIPLSFWSFFLPC